MSSSISHSHFLLFSHSLSQILEQIFNAAISLGAAWLFIHLLQKSTSQAQEHFNTLKAVQGASGSAIGTGAGVIIALLFILIIFIRSGKARREER